MHSSSFAWRRSCFFSSRLFARFFLLIFCLGGLISEAGAWWNNEWTIRKKITIDTSATGGAITENIGSSAVLVRLYDGNFQFASAHDDGSDIRVISGDDKTLLKFHLERYDTLLNEAYLWVKVPDIKPGAQTSFYIYYGNAGEKVERAEDSKGTYDSDTALVYHFGETNAPAADASGGGHSSENAGVPIPGGWIAGAVRFAGNNGITIPAAPDLAWTANGNLTWSAWIKPTVLHANTAVFSRRENDQTGLTIGLDNGVPYVETSGSGGTQRSPSGTPLAINIWRHLTLTASGNSLTLWLDGEKYASLPVGLPAATGPLILGKGGLPESAAGGEAASTFAGEMDEMQISRIARPPGWIRLSAIEQAGGDVSAKVLTFGADEASAHGSEGEISKHLSLLGDISKSLTFDGWVVIGLCTILAVIGWVVTVAKFLYLSRMEKATKAFLSHWQQLSANLHVLDHGDEENIRSMGGTAPPEAQEAMSRSPLYHIYQVGSAEIQHRLSAAAENFHGLSGRAMQTIRTALDGGLGREVQRLNGNLVFLTIGIAGGPYLGLLGTVIGVMITFAVIAKSGQVEVNSIAPGIAGALLATVAGLAVAIPALFAYSYISTRIREAVARMEMFIEEFSARIAEFYSSNQE